MFVDFPEVVIIFGVALVVLGPKKLPGTAAQVGRWVGRARAMARQFREQLEQEVSNVESALDTNPHRKPDNKPTAESTSPGEDAPSPQEGEAAVDNTIWHPEFGPQEAPPPYGDPTAIPQPDPSEAQLPLALDRPVEHATPAPNAAAPPEEAVQHPTGPDVR